MDREPPPLDDAGPSPEATSPFQSFSTLAGPPTHFEPSSAYHNDDAEEEEEEEEDIFGKFAVAAATAAAQEAARVASAAAAMHSAHDAPTTPVTTAVPETRDAAIAQTAAQAVPTDSALPVPAASPVAAQPPALQADHGATSHAEEAAEPFGTFAAAGLSHAGSSSAAAASTDAQAAAAVAQGALSHGDEGDTGFGAFAAPAESADFGDFGDFAASAPPAVVADDAVAGFSSLSSGMSSGATQNGTAVVSASTSDFGAFADVARVANGQDGDGLSLAAVSENTNASITTATADVGSQESHTEAISPATTASVGFEAFEGSSSMTAEAPTTAPGSSSTASTGPPSNAAAGEWNQTTTTSSATSTAADFDATRAQKNNGHERATETEDGAFGAFGVFAGRPAPIDSTPHHTTQSQTHASSPSEATSTFRAVDDKTVSSTVPAEERGDGHFAQSAQSGQSGQAAQLAQVTAQSGQFVASSAATAPPSTPPAGGSGAVSSPAASSGTPSAPTTAAPSAASWGGTSMSERSSPSLDPSGTDASLAAMPAEESARGDADALSEAAGCVNDPGTGTGMRAAGRVSQSSVAVPQGLRQGEGEDHENELAWASDSGVPSVAGDSGMSAEAAGGGSGKEEEEEEEESAAAPSRGSGSSTASSPDVASAALFSTSGVAATAATTMDRHNDTLTSDAGADDGASILSTDASPTPVVDVYATLEPPSESRASSVHTASSQDREKVGAFSSLAEPIAAEAAATGDTDGFGSFAEPAAIVSPVADDSEGFGSFAEPAPVSTAIEDDGGFGSFAEPAAVVSTATTDSEGFGSFAEPAAAVDDAAAGSGTFHADEDAFGSFAEPQSTPAMADDFGSFAEHSTASDDGNDGFGSFPEPGENAPVAAVNDDAGFGSFAAPDANADAGFGSFAEPAAPSTASNDEFGSFSGTDSASVTADAEASLAPAATLPPDTAPTDASGLQSIIQATLVAVSKRAPLGVLSSVFRVPADSAAPTVSPTGLSPRVLPALEAALKEAPEKQQFDGLALHRQLLASVKVDADQICHVPTLAGETPKYVPQTMDVLMPEPVRPAGSAIAASSSSAASPPPTHTQPLNSQPEALSASSLIGDFFGGGPPAPTSAAPAEPMLDLDLSVLSVFSSPPKHSKSAPPVSSEANSDLLSLALGELGLSNGPAADSSSSPAPGVSTAATESAGGPDADQFDFDFGHLLLAPTQSGSLAGELGADAAAAVEALPDLSFLLRDTLVVIASA